MTKHYNAYYYIIDYELKKKKILSKKSYKI